MKTENLLVRRIRNGTVIDHIPAGKALTVLRILGITGREGYRVAVVMNVESKKLGVKDIVKIEDRYLRPEEVNKIALIAPTATINIIREFRVVEKRKVSLPDVVEGIIKCINPSCITRREREPIKPKFKVLSRQPLLLQCMYCSTPIPPEDVERQLSEAM